MVKVKVTKDDRAENYLRPLKNVLFCSRSRKAKILITGIYLMLQGLSYKPDAEIRKISADFEN